MQYLNMTARVCTVIALLFGTGLGMAHADGLVTPLTDFGPRAPNQIHGAMVMRSLQQDSLLSPAADTGVTIRLARVRILRPWVDEPLR